MQTATSLADIHVEPMLGSPSLPWDEGLGFLWGGASQPVVVPMSGNNIPFSQLTSLSPSFKNSF